MDYTSPTAYEHIVKCVDMARNALSIIKDNLTSAKITNAGRVRSLSYLDSAKRWAIQIDTLLPDRTYVDKLANSLNNSTTDEIQCKIEYHPRQNVIVIDGAFDVEQLRKYIMSV